MRRQTFLISLISFLRLPPTKTMEHHGSHLLPGENGSESLELCTWLHTNSVFHWLEICNLAEKCRPPGSLLSGWDVLVTNDGHYSFGRRTLIWLRKLQIRVLGRVHPRKDRLKDGHNTGSYGPGGRRSDPAGVHHSPLDCEWITSPKTHLWVCPLVRTEWSNTWK